MRLWLERLLLTASDAVFSALPQPVPTPEHLARCRLISHRGERDDRRVFENTYAAFDPLRGSGIHGIEFDLRWTRDLVPVVFHDPDLLRLFGDRSRICNLDWAELHARQPGIPDLHSFVRRYADEFHLMLEVKAEHYPDPKLQQRRLLEALAPALATGRYHLISLHPEMLRLFPSIPPLHTLGIARFNLALISTEALTAGRGGVGCHYAFLRRADITRHHAAGQVVGTGFPNSRAALFRELNRGVDWIFSNEALKLQRILVVGPPSGGHQRPCA